MTIIATKNKNGDLTKQCSHVEDTYVGSKKCVECDYCRRANYGFCDYESVNDNTLSAIYDIQSIECLYEEVNL